MQAAPLFAKHGPGSCTDAHGALRAPAWPAGLPHEPQRVLADVHQAPQRLDRLVGRRSDIGELGERKQSWCQLLGGGPDSSWGCAR